jgi:hypothetical protein
VIAASELSEQERDDYAYTAAFIPALRKSYALPQHIGCTTIAEAVDTYGLLGIEAHQVIDMFKDTIGYQVDKLSQEQLVDTSLTLSTLGVSQQSELQVKLHQRIKGPLRYALLSQLQLSSIVHPSLVLT